MKRIKYVVKYIKYINMINMREKERESEGERNILYLNQIKILIKI